MPTAPMELRRCVSRASRLPDYRSPWARHAAQPQARWVQLTLYTLKRHLKYPLVLCHKVAPTDVPGVMRGKKRPPSTPTRELTSYWRAVQGPAPPPTPVVASKYFAKTPVAPRRRKRVAPSRSVLRERRRVRLLNKWIDSYAPF